MATRIIASLYIVLVISSIIAAFERLRAGATSSAMVSILIGAFCIWRLYMLYTAEQERNR